MSINITMPALSPTMEEGKLAKWHVKEGDSVSSGDVIAEIETDKATMEVEAVDEGKIGKIVVPEGTDNVKVNAVIAVLLQDGESTASVAAPPPAAKTPAPAAKAAEAPPAPAKAAPAPAPASFTPPAPPAEARNIPVSEANGKTDDFPLANGANGRIFASPLARRLAKAAGIDVGAIAGSGPHGRVVKSDGGFVSSRAASRNSSHKRCELPPRRVGACACGG